MSFLNSTILLLGSLALIPILIHLFNRQRVKRLEFSSVRYLKSLQKTRMRRLKIKQLILLILRTLIILTLVVAFARPTTEGSYSKALGSAAQASVVIMIDNSLSMLTETTEGTLFETARQSALEVCNNIASGDKIAVLAFNNKPIPLTNGFTSNHDFVRESLKKLTATRLGTKPQTAFEKALELLSASENYVKEIYIFSDLAGPDWKDIITLKNDENIKIYLNRLIKEDYENLKVTAINFGHSLIYPGRPVTISAEIINESKRRVDNLLVSLFVDQKRIAQTDISLSAHLTEKVSFTNIFENPGEHSGYIELTNDDLLEDNRWYFTISIPDQINVLALNESETDDHFLKLAFKPLPDSPTHINLTMGAQSRLASLDLFQYDLVLLHSSSLVSQADISKLASYVKSGGSILMFIPDDQNKDILNQKLFHPVFGTKLVSQQSVVQGEGFYRLSSLDFAHPIFSRFAEIDKDYLPEPDFYNLMQIATPGQGKTLASFSSGSPAIIEASWGSGKIIAFMSSYRNEDSDLVNHPFFVTFINRCAEYLAYDLNRLRDNFLTGHKISRTLLNIKPEKSLHIITPSQNKLFPAYTFAGSEVSLTIPEIDINGISEILVDDKSVEHFAVNYPPDESDGRFLSVSDFKKAFKGYEVISLEKNAEIGQIIQESRLGKELSRIFFILALIFIAAEMIIARGKPQSAEQSKN